MPVELLVLVRQVITGERLQRLGHDIAAALEEDGDDLLVQPTILIELLRGQEPFPRNAQSLAGLLAALEPAAVGLRAHGQHERCLVDLSLHPARPSLGRVGLVAVDPGVHALAPKLVCKFKHALRMRGRVVAVSDEDPFCPLAAHGPILCKTLSKGRGGHNG
jgi:hypothetical protein